jgi:hypothetical protein
MSAVNNVARAIAQRIDAGSVGAPTGASEPAGAPLPLPEMTMQAAGGDVMSIIYALTSKQRDADSSQRHTAANVTADTRRAAYQKMQDELQAAKDAKDDSGWLGTAMKVLDSAADAVVGHNPLQDVAHTLSTATNCKAFDIAYDFIRPDAVLNGAMMVASAATGDHRISEGYDIGAASSSLKTRFQGAADATGEPDVMEGYAVTRDAIASAMVTVGTCGVGAAAIFVIATSTALAVEAKFDLLGKAGVSDDVKMGLRLGAQAYVVAAGAGASIAGAAKGLVPLAGKITVNVVNGANQVNRGVVQVGQAIYDHETALHLKESTKYEAQQHQADRQQERIVVGLRELSQSFQRCLSTIANTMDERNQSTVSLARSIA